MRVLFVVVVVLFSVAAKNRVYVRLLLLKCIGQIVILKLEWRACISYVSVSK